MDSTFLTKIKMEDKMQFTFHLP